METQPNAVCTTEQKKTYYAENQQECKTRALNYYRANREKYLAYFRDYYLANRGATKTRRVKAPPKVKKSRGRPRKPKVAPVKEVTPLPATITELSPAPEVPPTILIQHPPAGVRGFLVNFE